MKRLFLIILTSLAAYFSSSCSQIPIAGEDVPARAICGSLGTHGCRAIGSRGGSFLVYEKERPDLHGAKHANLGRLFNLSKDSYHDVSQSYLKMTNSLAPNQRAFVEKKSKINYDFSKKTRAKLKAELEGQLKQAGVSKEATANLSYELDKQLSVNLKVEAYMVTYTIKDEIFDQAEHYVRTGEAPEVDLYRIKRFVDYTKGKGKPVIRQVRFIEEKVEFTGTENLTQTLELAAQGSQTALTSKVKGAFSAFLSSEEAMSLKSNSEQETVYSYGFYGASWLLKTE